MLLNQNTFIKGQIGMRNVVLMFRHGIQLKRFCLIYTLIFVKLWVPLE